MRDEESRISAKELRALGVDVPAEVPDCATIPRGSWKLLPKTVRLEGDVLTCTFDFELTTPFKWLDIEISIDKEKEE